jgi:hypothetical protein
MQQKQQESEEQSLMKSMENFMPMMTPGYGYRLSREEMIHEQED